jgi:hypothetical protein
MECNICGKETRKDRATCIGCHSLREVVQKKDKAPKSKVEVATKHLLKNPGLTIISWLSFSRK